MHGWELGPCLWTGNGLGRFTFVQTSDLPYQFVSLAFSESVFKCDKRSKDLCLKWFETCVEQEWPVCCTYGAGGGYLLGLVVTVILCFVNVRNVRPKQDWYLHTVGYFREPYICHFGSGVSCSFNYSEEFSFLQFLWSFQQSFALLEQFRLYCTNLVWQLMIERHAIMQESPVDSSLFCDYKEVIALLVVLQAVWREKLCGQLAESWTMIMSCSHWQYRGWKATHLEANQKEACYDFHVASGRYIEPHQIATMPCQLILSIPVSFLDPLNRVSWWQHAKERFLELQGLKGWMEKSVLTESPCPETSEDDIFPISKWLTQIPNL